MKFLAALLSVTIEFLRDLKGLALFLHQWSPGNPDHVFSNATGRAFKLLLNGFGPDAGQLYDFNKYLPQDYLSDYEIFCKAAGISVEYRSMLSDRQVLTDFLSPWIRLPKVYGRIIEGRLLPASDIMYRPDTPGQVFTFLKYLLGMSPTLLVKRARTSGRDDGLRLSLGDEKSLLINGRRINEMKAYRIIDDLEDHIITEYIMQGDYAAAIFPGSCNSIRLLTMAAPKGGRPFFAGCFHRFGTADSAPSDRLGRGGCIAAIDDKTGQIGRCFMAVNRELTWISHHPNTNVQILGTVVPNYQAIKEFILKQHHRISYIPYLAWDIVVQNENFVVLGVDLNPDLKGIQAFNPILASLPVREFYRHHGVIRR